MIELKSIVAVMAINLVVLLFGLMVFVVRGPSHPAPSPAQITLDAVEAKIDRLIAERESR